MIQYPIQNKLNYIFSKHFQGLSVKTISILILKQEKEISCFSYTSINLSLSKIHIYFKIINQLKILFHLHEVDLEYFLHNDNHDY